MGLLAKILPLLVAALGPVGSAGAQVPTGRAGPLPEAVRSGTSLVRPNSGRSTTVARDLQRAETAFRSGSSLPEAKARLDRVLAATPDDADARRLRAHVLLALGRPADALADAQRAAALVPADPELHLLVAEAARLAGDTERATAALDRVARMAVRDAGLHVRLAWNAAELGDLDRAEAFARIAVQQDATRPEAYLLLARVFVLERQEDAAAAVVARGAQAGVLDRATVQGDALLARLVDHPALRRVLR